MSDMKYPLTSFHFEVKVDGVASSAFSEVSGLEVENDVVEYHYGTNKAYNSMKMPGLRKYSNVTLKRGMTEGDGDFFKWISENQNNNTKRQTVTITLLDDSHKPKVTWTLDKAWVVKVSHPDMNAANSDVAIETLELAHEGLKAEMN